MHGYLLHIHWDKWIPYPNDLVHTSSDHGVVLGAVVNSGYAFWHTKHPLITSSLHKINKR